MRSLAHAVHHAAEVAAELRCLRVRLVVHDTFSLIGYLAARRIGVPRVNVWAGHALDPDEVARDVAAQGRLHVSASGRQAVEALRRDFGMADADPFAYLRTRSPDLNLYGEPALFLDDPDARARLEPLAFFGSLPDPGDSGAPWGPPPIAPRGRGEDVRRIYVSFGTVVWRVFEDLARERMGRLCDLLAARRDVRAVVTLGRADGAPEPALEAELTRPNVEVRSQVDPWNLLRWADVFLTHHGLNSTHEAVMTGTPMISYPFHWDQPAMAQTAQRLGLAVPLVREPRGSVGAEDLARALAAVRERRAVLAAQLERARRAELDVLAARDHVVDHVVSLARRPGRPGEAA